METIVIATGNKHKVSEIKEMLAPFTAGKYELISMREAGFDGEIEETGTTFEENAFIKASTVCRATGKITFADDSGLCVDALDGRPGVYSARYGGLDTDDEQISLLLSELKDVPAEKRTARFVAVFCAVFPDGGKLSARGECEGTILFERRGFDDFGYDPVFYYPPAGRTFAEMTQSEKCAVSHRGRAVRGFAKLFFKE